MITSLSVAKYRLWVQSLRVSFHVRLDRHVLAIHITHKYLDIWRKICEDCDKGVIDENDPVTADDIDAICQPDHPIFLELKMVYGAIWDGQLEP